MPVGRVRLPAGLTAKRIQLLTAGTAVPIQQRGDTINLTPLGDTTVPVASYRGISAPTLVLSGSESPEFLRQAARQVAEAIPGARHDVLAGQDHNVAADRIAPVVAGFAGSGRRESQ